MVSGSQPSTFKRAAARGSYSDVADSDRLAGRALCCCKPRTHNVSQRWAREALVGEHDRLGGAERNAGEQLKRSPPFDTDVTFLIAIDDSCAEVQLPR
jgi:hypothetical protein